MEVKDPFFSDYEWLIGFFRFSGTARPSILMGEQENGSRHSDLMPVAYFPDTRL